MSSMFPYSMLYDHYLFLTSFVACCRYLIQDLRLQDLLGLEGDDLAQFKALVGERYTLQTISLWLFPMDSCELFKFINMLSVYMAVSYVRTSQMTTLHLKSKTTFWRTWYLLTQLTLLCLVIIHERSPKIEEVVSFGHAFFHWSRWCRHLLWRYFSKLSNVHEDLMWW